MQRDSLGVAQNIETGVLEIWNTNTPNGTCRRESFKSPSNLSIEIKGGGVSLLIRDSGKLGFFQYDVSLEEGLFVFECISMHVLAQQAFEKEDSDTVKALRALGTHI